MTIELVDGHGGKPHISGDDLGDFKAGILGDAGYVFKRADMLAATLNGANSLTVNTGSGVLPVSGRHFRITAPETVTVTSGTQGQNRNDLVVIRPSTSTDGTTVENAALVVLRGTPTSGTATDPATQDGDLPLYRLQLTGVSVAEPIALFDVMVPYNEFRDSISQGDVLWSKASGWYMVETQEANLSKPISECATGVMLHWQGYEPGGTVGNYDHYYQYVPKHHVAKIDGAGIGFVMGSQAKIARKYLYVHDDYIQGHELNDQEVNMNDGGKFYNNRFVLTEVFEC